jgi:glutamate dehydrogenase
VRELAEQVPELLCGYQEKDLTQRSASAVERGAAPELAARVFRLIHLFPLPDIFDIADITERDGEEVAALYYALNDHLKIEWLLDAVRQLKRGDRWHSLARLAVRDDMYSSLRMLTLAVLNTSEPDESAKEKIADWELTNQFRMARARGVLAEIFATIGSVDLAALSVAAHQIRSMIHDGR